jgi:hypothetical protein
MASRTNRTPRAIASALGFLIALSMSRISAADADPAANALYDAAYDRWRALPVPPYATYDGRFALVRNGKTQVRLFDVAFRSADRRCRVTGVAIDARDRPEKPQVTRRCLTPDFAFSFIPQASSGASATGLDLSVPTPEPSGSPEFKTLASVRVRSRAYAVSFLADETIDGTVTKHLALAPFGDPHKHVLREIWIDPATDGVVRIRGEARSGPIHVDFVANYHEGDRLQTLVRVDAYAKAQVLFLRESGDVSFDLENVAYPRTLPDALFR